MGAEPAGTFQLDAHEISEALESLDGRAGITPDDMAQMEFRFISALERSQHGIPNLERQIAESPLLFVQAVALLYKRSDKGEDPPEWRIDDPERRAAVASAMHRLLGQIKRIPGTDRDGKIVAEDLTAWLTHVRELCAQYGRADIAEHCLGQLLSKAPPETPASGRACRFAKPWSGSPPPRSPEDSSSAFGTLAWRTSGRKAADKSVSSRRNTGAGLSNWHSSTRMWPACSKTSPPPTTAKPNRTTPKRRSANG